ncbi:MAG: formate dehydrogenase accessory sulfurtransferase FdhD [Lewinella sp.]|nr:formate dehydrogenase accessory sulfurtransferase FdhD [Lewinella sp.]
MDSTTSSGLQHRLIQRLHKGLGRAQVTDQLVVEEPLEIVLVAGPPEQRQRQSLAVTMRTPGQDAELALGFLLTEGLIGRRADVLDIRHSGQALHESAAENVLQVTLAPEVTVDWERLSRHFYTSSSCGVCGKASLEMVRTVATHYPRRGFPQVSERLLCQLTEQLGAAQTLFAATGGIHATAAFNARGELFLLREDVGRHNAMDKLIGAALELGVFPLREHLLLVSGRLSFELVQKAAMAGVPLLAAVGAPSSLAVELAEAHGMTLVGFLSPERCNLYCGEERLAKS